jgi:hypothetical protein
MKKYWTLLIIPFALACILFWTFLGEVEEYGREYALLSVGAVFFWGIFGILALSLNIAYWAGVGHLLEKALKNASKWLLYMVFVLYAAIGIYLEIKLGDGAKRLEDWYKDYQYQKEFEYKYKVDL